MLIKKEPKKIYFWLGGFIYTAVVAFLMQVLILPYIFPSLHAGNGLLKGLDSVSFHRIAVDLAEKMKSEGFQIWQLRPSGHSPAGIAALFYWIFRIPKPIILIPLNAVVHAASFFLLALFINNYVRKTSDRPLLKFAVALPFLFFPTAMNWYTQIHKDGFFILGFYLALYGIVTSFQLKNENEKKVPVKQLVKVFLSIFLGGICIWIARPYGVSLLFIVGILIGIVLIVYRLITFRKLQSLFIIAVYFLSLFVLLPFADTKGSEGVKSENIEQPPAEKIDNNGEDQKKIYKEEWNYKNIIPDRIEKYFYTIANSRYRFFLIYPHASSNIDEDARFQSLGDIVKYVPRALEISLFAPFPYQWFESGSDESGSIMRKVVGLEMVISYIILLGLPAAIYFYRRKIELWVVLFFSLSLMIVYAMSVPNVGAFHRMRYGFYMLILAIGMAGWIQIIKTVWKRKNSSGL
jgi:hypothetical protein